MSSRREFITLLGGAAVAWPVAARAQEDGPVARVGVLGPSLDRLGMRVAYPFFLADLRKLGFVEGRNLLVEFRPVEESVPGAFAAANELVAWKADVLFAFGTELALQAAASRCRTRKSQALPSSIGFRPCSSSSISSRRAVS